jgi:hypothetical protein
MESPGSWRLPHRYERCFLDQFATGNPEIVKLSKALGANVRHASPGHARAA